MEYSMNRYDPEVYTLPYWSGDTVYHEAVLPLQTEDGRIPDIALLYTAERILCVRSADLQTLYREGVDYALADGKLRILSGSAIQGMPHKLYYPDQPNDTCKKRNDQYGEGYIFFSESSLMHTLQLAVTYTHRDVFAGPIPVCKSWLLPRTAEKLKSGGKLRICVFGDSICVGGNSTGFLETPPMASPWYAMMEEQLRKQYPRCEISLVNASLGGKTSQWGAETAAQRAGYGPELCIIGFGMNDGTRRIAPEEYQKNIQSIMKAVSAGNPDCEFILLATALPNPMVGRFYGCQEAYLPMLTALERSGVAVADMTTFHKYLLTRKRFFDMSGNNVNHPNDFLARAYAQVILKTMLPQ